MMSQSVSTADPVSDASGSPASGNKEPSPQDGWRTGGLPVLRAELDKIDDAVHDLLSRHGAADLVTAGPDGLEATMLPFVYDRERSTLQGHFARNNDHWRRADGREVPRITYACRIMWVWMPMGGMGGCAGLPPVWCQPAVGVPDSQVPACQCPGTGVVDLCLT